jgi:hypothetical protein
MAAKKAIKKIMKTPAAGKSTPVKAPLKPAKKAARKKSG